MIKTIVSFMKTYLTFTRDYLYYFLKLGRINKNGYRGTSTIAIDFDGVMAKYERGMASRDEQGAPVEGAIKAIKELQDNSYKIIIWTSRPITNNLRKWFKKHNLNVYAIMYKPSCSMFIDDKCITFNGNWKETLEKIYNFRAWWDK